MTEARINLYFNLDDPKQRMAYLFLCRFKKKKNCVVTALIRKYMIEKEILDPGQMPQSKINDILYDLQSDVLKEHNAITSNSELLQLLSQMIKACAAPTDDAKLQNAGIVDKPDPLKPMDFSQISSIESSQSNDLVEMDSVEYEPEEEQKEELNNDLLSSIADFY